MNTCLPFNNKTLAPMLDVSIIFENNVYEVFGLTDTFQTVSLGKFNNVLDAYAQKVSYGFDGYTYEVVISPYENKTVEFTLD
jgi:hypothetical protein